MTLSDNKPHPAPTVNPHQKLHSREIYATVEGLLVVPVNVPHLFILQCV